MTSRPAATPGAQFEGKVLQRFACSAGWAFYPGALSFDVPVFNQGFVS